MKYEYSFINYNTLSLKVSKITIVYDWMCN